MSGFLPPFLPKQTLFHTPNLPNKLHNFSSIILICRANLDLMTKQRELDSDRALFSQQTVASACNRAHSIQLIHQHQ